MTQRILPLLLLTLFTVLTSAHQTPSSAKESHREESNTQLLTGDLSLWNVDKICRPRISLNSYTSWKAEADRLTNVVQALFDDLFPAEYRLDRGLQRGEEITSLNKLTKTPAALKIEIHTTEHGTAEPMILPFFAEIRLESMTITQTKVVHFETRVMGTSSSEELTKNLETAIEGLMKRASWKFLSTKGAVNKQSHSQEFLNQDLIDGMYPNWEFID